MAGALLGAFVIVVASSALGIVVNHFSAEGVPLIRESSEEAPALELPAGVIGIGPEAAQAILGLESTLFLDARSPEEYEEGHVPGSLNLPPGEFEEHFLDLMDPIEEASAIVVYCDGDECSDAIELAERLLEVGRTDILLIEGGWRAWSESEGPVSEGPDP